MGDILIIDVNPKEYEADEIISTKLEINKWMLSTLKNAKPI